jgi:hypothetical protein
VSSVWHSLAPATRHGVPADAGLYARHGAPADAGAWGGPAKRGFFVGTRRANETIDFRRAVSQPSPLISLREYGQMRKGAEVDTSAPFRTAKLASFLRCLLLAPSDDRCDLVFTQRALGRHLALGTVCELDALRNLSLYGITGFHRSVAVPAAG